MWGQAKTSEERRPHGCHSLFNARYNYGGLDSSSTVAKTRHHSVVCVLELVDLGGARDSGLRQRDR